MTWVRWQCSQNISWVSIGKGLLGPIDGQCGGNGGRGGSLAERGGGYFAKHSIDSNDRQGGGGFVVLGGRSSRESKNARGKVGGVEKMSSTGSKLMVRGEECLEGCVGADGGEVSGGGDDFGSKILIGEILRVVIGEGGKETFGDDGGAICLKPHLNKLNWKNGNLFQRVNDLKAKLCEIQGRIDKDPTNTMLRTEGVNVLNKFNEAADDEEKLLRQKAKVTWLAEGDKNSAYFHKFLKGRLNRSRIMSICAEDGKRYENCEVPGQFVKHFEGFLGIIPDVTKLNEEDNVLFEKTISLNEANLMIREITEEEIKKALFDIDDNKAPDPNGFTSKFYKKSCQIIRMDFCDAIKEFFSSGKLLGECISKILTNRIKVALSQIVDENQSAFVPGRAITDNILLTQELLKGYNCINGPKRCAFKIDIQKAYDTVSWEFLKDIIYGYFKGGRGLRQGDPISPYIFTMVMEMVFVTILRNALNKFSAMSGLYPNLSKCTMFCGSLNKDAKREISSIFPFKEGKLPVRYLGVPLITKKISVKECKQLVDKVSQKLNDWKNKSLSYARRAQLIASILGSMKVYWGSVFLLPKTIVNDIEKLFKRFLWNNGDSCKGKAKVERMVGKWPARACMSERREREGEICERAGGLQIIIQGCHRRLEKWYPSKKFKCGLCNKEPDSHEHLFFKCVYAQYIWKKICRMAKLKLKEDNWGNILEEMSKDKSQGSIWGVIRKLCLAASVYFIWHERNRRLFNNCKRDEDELFKITCEEIKAKMVSIKVKHNVNTIQAETVWSVKFTRN
ncbi:RNA-directed DNA polymerase, eukaryota, reverse transcriptase zinc-binding domain protein [Tanacetum coccineum]